MPTGYTAAIADGITFEQFALQCARAFGALITMRDDPTDAPIPDRFEPYDYHQKMLEKIHSEVERVQDLSPQALSDAADVAYRDEVSVYQGLIEKSLSLREKYNAMLISVRSWKAPTPDHQGLRDFMEQQIVDSMRHDCDTKYYEEAMAAIPKLTPEEWRVVRIALLRKDLAYHESEHRNEVERAATRTAWVQALKASLK